MPLYAKTGASESRCESSPVHRSTVAVQTISELEAHVARWQPEPHVAITDQSRLLDYHLEGLIVKTFEMAKALAAQMSNLQLCRRQAPVRRRMQGLLRVSRPLKSWV